MRWNNTKSINALKQLVVVRAAVWFQLLVYVTQRVLILLIPSDWAVLTLRFRLDAGLPVQLVARHSYLSVLIETRVDEVAAASSLSIDHQNCFGQQTHRLTHRLEFLLPTHAPQSQLSISLVREARVDLCKRLRVAWRLWDRHISL